MTTLNKLKKLRLEYPNDKEFGAEVSKYLNMHETCCDKVENRVSFEDLDTHPYGTSFAGVKCGKCGQILLATPIIEKNYTNGPFPEATA